MLVSYLRQSTNLNLPRLLSVPLSNIRYTKKYFEDLNIDEEQIKRNAEIAKQKQLKQSILNIPQNDRNSNNCIKNLRINGLALQSFQNFEKSRQIQSCQILTPQPIKPLVFISAKRKYIITTLKKATIALHPLKKKYLYDAINSAQVSNKKVVKLIMPTFYNLIRHALDRGFDPFRLFIHGILVGKTMRYKGIRYHARGKTGRETKDICQVKIILYEKDEDLFWKDIGSGRAPPGFALYVRTRLVEIKANHQKIMQYTGITTSKGRQQKRQIIKRRTDMKMLENKEAGVYVPKKTIFKQIQEQQGLKAKQLFRNLKAPEQMSSLKKRQLLFKSNQSIQ